MEGTSRGLFFVLTLLLCVLRFTTGYKYYYMENYCNGGRGEGSLDLSKQPVDYGRMRLTGSSGYRRNMDCWLNITAPPGKGLVIRINRVEIYRPLFDSCTSDMLRIYSVTSDGKHAVGGYICGTGRPYNATILPVGAVALHFVSGNWLFFNWRRGFDIVFTSYRKPIEMIGNKTVEGNCWNSSFPGGEYECSHRPYGKMCIPRQLKCDSFDNCGDYSDERCGLSGGQIAGIVIGVLGGVGLLCVCVACVAQKSHRSKETDRIRAQGRIAMVHMPTVQGGDVEPPPLYTTHAQSFDNSAYVAPPPYTAAAVTPAVTSVPASTTVTGGEQMGAAGVQRREEPYPTKS